MAGNGFHPPPQPAAPAQVDQPGQRMVHGGHHVRVRVVQAAIGPGQLGAGEKQAGHMLGLIAGGVPAQNDLHSYLLLVGRAHSPAPGVKIRQNHCPCR